MTAVSVLNGATPTVIFTPPTQGFLWIHIYNNGTVPVFVQFDSDSASLTASNGFPIAAGETYVIENRGRLSRERLYTAVIKAIHQSGSAQEVRIQTG